MFDIDVDFEEIERITNPSAKKIAHQLKLNGHATTKDSRISLEIRNKLPSFRNKHNPKILMASDRRTQQKIIMINPNLVDTNKELEKFIKKMIKIF